MSAPRFCHFELRTIAVPAATAFYQAVLGRQGDAIIELPAAAAARGAPAHWLGHIAVGEIGGVDAVLGRMLDKGGTQLGPAGSTAIVRDAGGAIFALADAGRPSVAGVDWHVLLTADAQGAAARHGEIFGWALTERQDLGALGMFQQFAWRAGEASVGAIGDIAGRPAVHPQWLFFFGVDALDGTLTRVRATGGQVLGPVIVRSGFRTAVCCDPQGASFGLQESR